MSGAAAAGTDSDAAIVLANDSAAYDGRPVLSGLDLTVRAGERVALMGRSGAGKSTLHILRTLVRPARADVAAVEAILDRIGLADRLWARAGELSGGQQQRVSVARALYNGRPILVGDEPVSALDRQQGARILAELARSHETLILALHDMALALSHTDRIVVLEAGRIVLDAPSAGPRSGAAQPVLRGRLMRAVARKAAFLPRPGYAAVSRWFAAAALAGLLVANLQVTTLHPFADLARLLGGLIRPDCPAVEGWSVVTTVAFAMLGVGLGAGTGLLLAIPFARSRAVRLRLDVAVVLIAATALMTVAVDPFSRALRRSLRIDALLTRLSGPQPITGADAADG
ncbi:MULTISPECIES: ATP-binding cassette domain-containing protein [Methylobacterium]|uniref:ATP-binding cassette domain-containing protein n=1 Tax=Methylobacterium TaxID=407 RepID=UPI002F35A635